MDDASDLHKILIYSATQKDSARETSLWKSFDILTWPRYCTVDLKFEVENTRALTEVYNEGLEFADKWNYDAVVFIHDDVTLEHEFVTKLENLFNDFDIVGVAGASKIDLESSVALWHLMGGGFGGGNLHGAVSHGTVNRKMMTSFGPYPQRVVMIDGVFMAISSKVFKSISFDENNPARFHFYDLDFSLTAAKQGIKVGVGDIVITHESPGLSSFTDEWKAGEKWFLNKHS